LAEVASGWGLVRVCLEGRRWAEGKVDVGRLVGLEQQQ